MTTFIKTHLDKPVASYQDLIDYLARGAKPQSEWRIGAEMEKLVVDAETGEAATYSRINALLEALQGMGHWQGVYEGEHLVALKDQTSSVTLEPGGQLELSGALCPDIHCCQRGFATHNTEITAAASSLGLRFLGLGVQPFSGLENIGWVPKTRYDIMGPYMRHTGDMGQRMMKQSAGLQVNFDYRNEDDCFRKLRLAFYLAPLFYALFANSPLLDGKPSGFLSTRGEIWSRTDKDRSGLIPRMLHPGAGFSDYVEYALDVPMYFIIREGRYLSLTQNRFTFRQFIADGFAGHHALLGDWDLHLSTLFPEARLRPQIEIRSADSLPPYMTMSVAALVKGIFYDDQGLEETSSLFRTLTPEALTILYRQAWKTGLKTPFQNGTLQSLAQQVIRISRQSLIRQADVNEYGQDESTYLDSIEELAVTGVTLAERLLAHWHGSKTQRLQSLYNHCGF